MEESRAAENTDLDNMRKEFCDRISVTEKKLQTVSKVSISNTLKIAVFHLVTF